MKSAKAIGLVQAITSATLVLLLVYQQADCVGLLHHQKTARLTTYGNHQTGSKTTTTTPKPIAARECKSDGDCGGIANTTCMRHPKDNKLHCLCGDKKPPENASCHKSKQGLRGRCNLDSDCIKYAVCRPNNATKSKACECMEGYEEEDHECSSSPFTRVPSTQAVFLLLFCPFLLLVQ